MNTKKWGPPAWEFLHAITFNYPIKPTPNDKQRIKNLFYILGDNYPCAYCRDSYKIFIEEIKIDKFYDSRYGVVLWLYLIHDLVNKKLGKKSIPFKEVVSKYEKQRAGASKHTKDKHLYVVNCFLNETSKRYQRCVNYLWSKGLF